MYTEFYGLQEKPFALVPDPKYLFLAAGHREALAHLLYAIEEGEGFVEIVGQVGTGKTTLCRTLLDRVGSDVEIAFIFNPSSSEVELLASICREFGLPTAARSRVELSEALNRFLLERKAVGRRALLVIDEAQNLEPDVLEQIRLLSNLETEREKLIHIVLIGQPELEENLKREDLRQLRQRVTVRWNLQPFDRNEVRDYLEHRLRIAGLQKPDLFTAGAIRAIYRATRGIPRLINAIADRALLAGYSKGRRQIDARLVNEAAKELPSSETRLSPRPELDVPPVFAFGLVAIGLLIGLVYTVSIPGIPNASAGASVGSANPQVAAPAPQIDPDRDFEARVRKAGLRGSVASSIDAVIARWGYPALERKELDPNLIATVVGESSSLRVSVLRSNREQIRHLNIPAVIELEFSETERRYAALLRIKSEQRVELGLNGEVFEVSSRFLDRIWTGRAFLLWNNYESLPALTRGMNGTAVRWLQARLTELGYLNRGDASGEFDARTVGAIRRFQLEKSLADSGEVGPETLITLYQLLHYGAPRLLESEELS